MNGEIKIKILFAVKIVSWMHEFTYSLTSFYFTISESFSVYDTCELRILVYMWHLLSMHVIGQYTLLICIPLLLCPYE